MKKVLVAGAGPVGLATALELTRRGAAVRIIDKSADRTHLSKAVGINARTLELLEPAGVTPQLIEAGLPLKRMTLRYDDRVLTTIALDKTDHRFNFILSLPQSETERILEAALAARGVTVERKTELSGFEQSAVGVSARLIQDNRVDHFIGDYIAGCDGAHSAVRKALGVGFSGERYPDEWSLADIRMDWPYGHGGGDLIMRPDNQVLFVVSLPDGRFRVIANAPDVLTLLPESSRVTEILWQTNFSVSLRQVDSYGSGRVFLAGDAAHIHSPAGGRGMNLGIEDGCVLARRTVEGGLERYSADRHRVGAQVVRESDQQFRLAAIRNPLLKGMRNLIVRYVLGCECAQAPFRRRMAGIDHPAI